ncbi:hypothetical protein SprV_0200569600 [Sparganum proliferum]
MSQLRPPCNANAQPPPTCPRCQRTFRARIGLAGHLRINCAHRTAPTVVPPPNSSSSPTATNKSDRSPEPPLPSSSSFSSTTTSCSSSSPFPTICSSSSSSAVPTPAAVTPSTRINTTHNPDTSSNINTTTVNNSGKDQDCTCPHCDRTFTSHIGLVGHLRIHRTETGEPVPGAPAYTRLTSLYTIWRDLDYHGALNSVALKATK